MDVGTDVFEKKDTKLINVLLWTKGKSIMNLYSHLLDSALQQASSIYEYFLGDIDCSSTQY